MIDELLKLITIIGDDMKLNKILIIVLLGVGFALLSCGEKSSPESRTIKFWNFWSEPYQKLALDTLIKEFEQKNDCKVELTQLSWNDGKTKLFAAFNSNTAPDVLELGSDWVAQFSDAGVLASLPPDSMNIDNFIEFSKQPSYWKGKLFAIPWIVDTRVLFYNKDLLRMSGMPAIPPITLDEVQFLAERINSPQEGVFGWGANGSDPHRLYKKIMYFFWTMGNPIFNDQNRLDLNSEGNVKALNKYVELSRYGIIDSQRQLDALFTRGRIALLISGGWLLEKIKNENPDMDFGTALVPGVNDLNGIRQGISFAGGEYLAISKQAKNKELAKEFIRYMTKGENAIRFCKKVIEAGFPADKNNYNDPYYKSQPNRETFAKQLEYARMTPVLPEWLEIEAIIEQAAEAALLGQESSDVALKKAHTAIRKLMMKK